MLPAAAARMDAGDGRCGSGHSGISQTRKRTMGARPYGQIDPQAVSTLLKRSAVPHVVNPHALTQQEPVYTYFLNSSTLTRRGAGPRAGLASWNKVKR